MRFALKRVLTMEEIFEVSVVDEESYQETDQGPETSSSKPSVTIEALNLAVDVTSLSRSTQRQIKDMDKNRRGTSWLKMRAKISQSDVRKTAPSSSVGRNRGGKGQKENGNGEAAKPSQNHQENSAKRRLESSDGAEEALEIVNSSASPSPPQLSPAASPLRSAEDALEKVISREDKRSRKRPPSSSVFEETNEKLRAKRGKNGYNGTIAPDCNQITKITLTTSEGPKDVSFSLLPFNRFTTLNQKQLPPPIINTS